MNFPFFVIFFFISIDSQLQNQNITITQSYHFLSFRHTHTKKSTLFTEELDSPLYLFKIFSHIW